jgi:hypothetical protein
VLSKRITQTVASGAWATGRIGADIIEWANYNDWKRLRLSLVNLFRTNVFLPFFVPPPRRRKLMLTLQGVGESRNGR